MARSPPTRWPHTQMGYRPPRSMSGGVYIEKRHKSPPRGTPVGGTLADQTPPIDECNDTFCAGELNQAGSPKYPAKHPIPPRVIAGWRPKQGLRPNALTSRRKALVHAPMLQPILPIQFARLSRMDWKILATEKKILVSNRNQKGSRGCVECFYRVGFDWQVSGPLIRPTTSSQGARHPRATKRGGLTGADLPPEAARKSYPVRLTGLQALPYAGHLLPQAAMNKALIKPYLFPHQSQTRPARNDAADKSNREYDNGLNHNGPVFPEQYSLGVFGFWQNGSNSASRAPDYPFASMNALVILPGGRACTGTCQRPTPGPEKKLNAGLGARFNHSRHIPPGVKPAYGRLLESCPALCVTVSRQGNCQNSNVGEPPAIH
jgi:hypothetical protein